MAGQVFYLVRSDLDDIKAACVQLEDGSRAWHETGMPGLIVCSFDSGQATVYGPITVGNSPVFKWFEVNCKPEVLADIPADESGPAHSTIAATAALQSYYRTAPGRTKAKNSSNQSVGMLPINATAGQSPLMLATGGQDPDEMNTIPGLE